MILGRYLSAWGGIICRMNDTVNLVFIDTCAGPGSYQDTKNRGLKEGSPLIALQTLSSLKTDTRFAGKVANTKSLFIEKNPKYASALRRLLGSGNTFGETYEIKESEFDSVLEDILAFAKGFFTFIFAEPFGPSSIPFTSISRVVSQKFCDVLINFPFYSIQKWSGFIDDYDCNDLARERVDYVTNFFGTDEWIDIYKRHLGTEKLEDEWLNLYKKNLKNAGVMAVSAPVLFEQKERSIFHLIFTTRNLAGLMAMKETMYSAKREEAKRREELQRQTKYPGQMSFAEVNESWGIPVASSIRSSPEEITRQIAETMGKGVFSRRQIYEKFISDIPYLQGDINKALTVLKKQGKADYAGKLIFDQQIKLIPNGRDKV
jgi:three-Cys-motif partner protein